MAWIEQTSCPITLSSNCCWLNSQEFITCPKYEERSPEKNGIWSYHTVLNTWSLHYKYPDDCMITTPTSHPLLFDKVAQKIYVYGLDPLLNKSNTINVIPDTNNIGYNSAALMIQNSYHLIGGQNNRKHLKWNPNKKMFKEKCTLDKFKKGNESHGFSYVESQNILLMFGGYDNYKYVDSIWCANPNKKKIKWKQLHLCLPKQLSNFGHTLVRFNNQEYILLFGGMPGDSCSIYIWNLLTMTITQSITKCPLGGRLTAICNYAKVKNELLIYGFTRNINSAFLIGDILMLINLWTDRSDDCVYLLHASGRLWKICLKELFT